MDSVQALKKLIESTEDGQMKGADFKRLSGRVDPYASWTHEKVEDSGVYTVDRVRIRRLARQLDEERYGAGASTLQFDPHLVEKLMEGAAHQHLAKQHWDARVATAKAHEIDKGGDSNASYHSHKDAAQLHHNAAQQLSAAGSHQTAAVHAAWAHHHERHAEHHAMKGKAKSAPAAKAAPTAAPTKVSAPAAKSEPAKAAPKASAGYERHADPFKASDHSTTAHRMTQAASALSKGTHASDKELAGVHQKASQANLVAAVHAFKSGDHDTALRHFNQAIHHATKKTHHEKTGMDKAMAVPKQGPGGARAATGRTSVPRH